MHRHRLVHFVLATFATLAAGLPASGQTWSAREADGGARASVCPLGADGSDDFLCFRLECTADEPLHFVLDIAGRGPVTGRLPVQVGVDGGEVGVLTFAPREAEGYARLAAGYDPRLHDELVDLLQRGRRASLGLDLGAGPEEVEVGLTGSADSLYTVIEACPKPAPPVDDPAGLVLDEVVAACAERGGTVALEPGFERREDLDGDGREDIVIDYAAAVCSELASLNCSSGGCTVGFFLARDGGYKRMFADVIRGYEVVPGGFLALDLHGTACGLYGFEACRKVYDVVADAPVLVEEIAGPGAETVEIAGVDPDGPAGADAADPAPAAATETAVVVEVEDDPAAEAEADAPVTVAAADPAEATPPVADAEAAVVSAAVPAVSGATPAAAQGDDEGPTSRHLAGPAPTVPADAEFRGDGTMIVPEADVALQ